MKCIKCGSTNQLVTNSRVKGSVVCRTRRCSECGSRWRTVEYYDPHARDNANKGGRKKHGE